ncbi:helical backbone metal receptor [uncultured Winogradskyella sp.]|uniref:ABC transporter substrate-binding protein n=1 Tax=uncultured Winogradskyella sp. TaxID=395353 RepID=UPI00261A93DE|nr:helical backbone metal receptor [uncultured Winogradskyella sp.]
MIFTDQLNRKLQISERAKRIVSLVPSQTELLVDLGLETSIVGVTKFCAHPKHLRKKKTVVGGTKQIHVEKIKALQPDIILCNKEENTQSIIEELESIAPIHISDIYNIDDCYALINMYGELFQVKDKALHIVSKIKKQREQFQNNLKGNNKYKVAYFIWKAPWMVAASHTFIDYMINEAGFVNVFKEEKRYPEIELNNSKLQEADIIFLSSEPYPFKEAHILELRSNFPKVPVRIVDGELFSWYGSRLLASYTYFQSLHYLV